MFRTIRTPKRQKKVFYDTDVIDVETAQHNDIVLAMNRNVAICYTDGSASPNPGPSGAGACIFRNTPDVVIDIGFSLGHGTNNTAELYALGMLFVELTRLHLSNPSITLAHIFCDSKLALLAAVSKKAPLTNGALTRALRVAYAAIPASLRCELHWIRGHSSVGGNERVDRISKAFASIAFNNSYATFDVSFPAHSVTNPWIPGFPLTSLPTSVFISSLPTPPALCPISVHIEIAPIVDLSDNKHSGDSTDIRAQNNAASVTLTRPVRRSSRPRVAFFKRT